MPAVEGGYGAGLECEPAGGQRSNGASMAARGRKSVRETPRQERGSERKQNQADLKEGRSVRRREEERKNRP
jgi:hypothetical protein